MEIHIYIYIHRYVRVNTISSPHVKIHTSDPDVKHSYLVIYPSIHIPQQFPHKASLQLSCYIGPSPTGLPGGAF